MQGDRYCPSLHDASGAEPGPNLASLTSALASCCGLSTDSVFTLRFVTAGQNVANKLLPERVNEKQAFPKKNMTFLGRSEAESETGDEEINAPKVLTYCSVKQAPPRYLELALILNLPHCSELWQITCHNGVHICLPLTHSSNQARCYSVAELQNTDIFFWQIINFKVFSQIHGGF